MCLAASAVLLYYVWYVEGRVMDIVHANCTFYPNLMMLLTYSFEDILPYCAETEHNMDTNNIQARDISLRVPAAMML